LFFLAFPLARWVGDIYPSMAHASSFVEVRRPSELPFRQLSPFLILRVFVRVPLSRDLVQVHTSAVALPSPSPSRDPPSLNQNFLGYNGPPSLFLCPSKFSPPSRRQGKLKRISGNRFFFPPCVFQLTSSSPVKGASPDVSGHLLIIDELLPRNALKRFSEALFSGSTFKDSLFSPGIFSSKFSLFVIFLFSSRGLSPVFTIAIPARCQWHGSQAPSPLGIGALSNRSFHSGGLSPFQSEPVPRESSRGIVCPPDFSDAFKILRGILFEIGLSSTRFLVGIKYSPSQLRRSGIRPRALFPFVPLGGACVT